MIDTDFCWCCCFYSELNLIPLKQTEKKSTWCWSEHVHQTTIFHRTMNQLQEWRKNDSHSLYNSRTCLSFTKSLESLTLETKATNVLSEWKVFTGRARQLITSCKHVKGLQWWKWLLAKENWKGEINQPSKWLYARQNKAERKQTSALKTTVILLSTRTSWYLTRLFDGSYDGFLARKHTTRTRWTGFHSRYANAQTCNIKVTQLYYRKAIEIRTKHVINSDRICVIWSFFEVWIEC